MLNIAKMRRYFCWIATLVIVLAWATSETRAEQSDGNALLLELDKAIENRRDYAIKKSQEIRSLTEQARQMAVGEELYLLNERIIDQYNTFRSDSATQYILRNKEIARVMGMESRIVDCELRLAGMYSVSGLFLQADELFDKFDFEALTNSQKAIFCWNKIRYYEHLQMYCNNEKFAKDYSEQIDQVRHVLMDVLGADSELYTTEFCFSLIHQGRYNEALEITLRQFNDTNPNTHGYAMKSMLLSRIYRLTGNRERENHYLTIAALTDIKLAVKENEALQILATNLFEAGDVSRAYTYMKAALDDANFYNSRFKSSIIARMLPIIESRYMSQQSEHQSLMFIAIAALSVLVVALVMLVLVIRKQRNTIAASQENLHNINVELSEAHFVKEQYISYFMKQCSDYINKLHLYRKEVNRKVKNHQAEDLYKPSNKELEREIEELMRNFDEAFLNICPKFIERFNALLVPEARYIIEDKHLNTELRIFALMRLGITNISQIAEFLQCSPQTIYNYKSKIKSKTLPHITNIEEEIQRMRLLMPNSSTMKPTKDNPYGEGK